MTERAFPIEQRIHNGRSHTAYIIRCRKCDASDFVVRGTGKATTNAANHFRRRGWDVGRGPHMDICELCSKPPKRIHVKPPEVKPMTVEKPREMSREDRQRIHASIGEHYMENSYEPPWTDKLKAEHLKVPLAWVAEIRDQFYGPEGSNPLYEKFSADIAAVDEMFRKIEIHQKEFDELRNMVLELQAMRRKIETELKGLKRAA